MITNGLQSHRYELQTIRNPTLSSLKNQRCPGLVNGKRQVSKLCDTIRDFET